MEVNKVCRLSNRASTPDLASFISNPTIHAPRILHPQTKTRHSQRPKMLSQSRFSRYNRMYRAFSVWLINWEDKGMVQLYGRVCRPSFRLLPYSTVDENRHNLTEATREMVKKSTDDVKNLASFPAGGPHVHPFLLSRNQYGLIDRHHVKLYKVNYRKNSQMPSLVSNGFRDYQRRSRGVRLNRRRGPWTGW